MTGEQASETLRGTVSADKNELLFTRFHINYNNEPEVWRRGTLVLRVYPPATGEPSAKNTQSSPGTCCLPVACIR